MTIKLGITGGIGSGKSIISDLLEVMGIPVYIADIRSKWLTEHDPTIKRSLIELLGEEVYEGNKINKPLLASYVFSGEENTQRINNIIHPVVKEDFKKWLMSHINHKMVGIESAILIEAGFRDVVDEIIMVYAPLELRLNRVIQRDHSSIEQVSSRVRSQMDDEQKKALADYIISNDDYTALIPQLEKILNKVREKHLS